MKLDELLKKEGMTHLVEKLSPPTRTEPSGRKRERPWFQTEDSAAGQAASIASNNIQIHQPLKEENQESEAHTETYGKPTENRRTIYGKPTEILTKQSTENLRKIDGNRNLRKPKPTDTPTDIGRKMDGKPTEISSLVGFQRLAFFELAQQAKELGFSDDSGNRITPPINGNIFAQQSLQKPYKQAKDVIYELKVAEFLSVYKVKNGRGGFVQYLIQKVHYQAFLLNGNFAQPTDNGRKTYGKPTDKPTDTPTEATPCSSSDLNISKNTTTTEPDFWLSVPNNLDGLVAVKQLREFVRQGLLSAEDLQTSLDGFAFDLEKGAIKAKNGNPVSILIGALKGGGYISQQYLNELKASLAEIEKARGELYKLQAENVAEQLKAEFESFREQFPEQAEKLKPTGKLMNSFQPGSIGYRMWLEEYKKNQAAKSDEAVL